MSNLSFSHEPALYIGFANALLLVLVTFGVPLSGDQKTAIDTLLGAVLAIVAGIAIRSQVTPVSQIPAPVPAVPVVPGPPTG